MDLEPDECQKAEKLEAKYANYFQIGHNAIDFLVVFGQSYTDDQEPLLHTRIITNPAYAKKLLILLEGSLREYESRFGPISES